MTAHKDWFTALTEALDKTKNEGRIAGVFQLATYDKSSAVPCVRTHVLRAFLVPSTQPTPSVPLLVTTTDVRSSKIDQIISAESNRIEVVFWTESTMEQFRIMGPVYIIPPPSHTSVVPQPGESAVFDALRETDGIDWEQTRRDTFNTLNPRMRASWCRPMPGPLEGGYNEGLAWPQTVSKVGEAVSREDEERTLEALDNFALLVIEPLQVDYVELGTVPEKRTVYAREPGQLYFDETIVVP